MSSWEVPNTYACTRLCFVSAAAAAKHRHTHLLLGFGSIMNKSVPPGSLNIWISCLCMRVGFRSVAIDLRGGEWGLNNYCWLCVVCVFVLTLLMGAGLAFAHVFVSPIAIYISIQRCSIHVVQESRQTTLRAPAITTPNSSWTSLDPGHWP